MHLDFLMKGKVRKFSMKSKNISSDKYLGKFLYNYIKFPD